MFIFSMKDAFTASLLCGYPITLLDSAGRLSESISLQFFRLNMCLLPSHDLLRSHSLISQTLQHLSASTKHELWSSRSKWGICGPEYIYIYMGPHSINVKVPALESSIHVVHIRLHHRQYAHIQVIFVHQVKSLTHTHQTPEVQCHVACGC